jgi:hypothetical protein
LKRIMSKRRTIAIFVAAGSLLAGCDEPSARQARADPQIVSEVAPAIAYSEPAATGPVEPVRDEKSDCAPGAPPNSLANALDVMRVHCDREKAYRRLGGLAAIALVGRFGGVGTAARSAAAASTVEAGLAGRTALAGARVAGIAAQHMDMSDDPNPGATPEARPGDGPPDEQRPISVTDIGGGYYQVELSDGATYRTDAEGAQAAIDHRGD